jgi:hypothetical protein
VRVERSQVQGLHNLTRPAHPEVRRDDAAQRGRRTATVLVADRVPQGHRAQLDPPAEVAADGTDRGEPGDAAVGSDARAVRPVAADHGDPPGPVGAGPEHREAVVADDVLSRDRVAAQPAADPPVVDRQIGPGQAEDAELRDRTGVRVPPGGARRGARRLRDRTHVLVLARHALHPGTREDPRGAQHGPVPTQEGGVDLAPAAVDRQHCG